MKLEKVDFLTVLLRRIKLKIKVNFEIKTADLSIFKCKNN